MRFLASRTLVALVAFLLFLFWFSHRLDVLSLLTCKVSDFGFFNSLRWWGESLEVVSNDLLLTWKERGLHLQGLCVRLLILLRCLITWLVAQG